MATLTANSSILLLLAGWSPRGLCSYNLELNWTLAASTFTAVIIKTLVTTSTSTIPSLCHTSPLHTACQPSFPLLSRVFNPGSVYCMTGLMSRKTKDSDARKQSCREREWVKRPFALHWNKRFWKNKHEGLRKVFQTCTIRQLEITVHLLSYIIIHKKSLK